jgi:hypothetical protein
LRYFSASKAGSRPRLKASMARSGSALADVLRGGIPES